MQIAALIQVPVDAIGAHVECAVLKPFYRHVRISKGRVLHPGKGLDPLDSLCLIGPETLRIRE